MFTGIIETTGQIREIIPKGSNLSFWIGSTISPELRIDQSLSHNGACLTIEEIRDSMHRVTVIEETIKKTTIGSWKRGDFINLERSLVLNGRLDGHMVQGHVDSLGICHSRKEMGGSWVFDFSIPGKFSNLIIEKGSISIDGISLTIFNVKKKRFSVAIIPYTFENTNIKGLLPGQEVNIEFDMIGKYVVRFRENFPIKT